MATYVADNDNTGFDDMYFAAPLPVKCKGLPRLSTFMLNISLITTLLGSLRLFYNIYIHIYCNPGPSATSGSTQLVPFSTYERHMSGVFQHFKRSARVKRLGLGFLRSQSDMDNFLSKHPGPDYGPF